MERARGRMGERKGRLRVESGALVQSAEWLAALLSWEPAVLTRRDGMLAEAPPPPLSDSYTSAPEYLALLSRHRVFETAACLASDARDTPAKLWRATVRAHEPLGGPGGTVDLLVRLEQSPLQGALAAEDVLLVRRADEAWEEAEGERRECLALALSDANTEIWIRVASMRSANVGCNVGAQLQIRRCGTLLPALRMQASLRLHSACPRWMLNCRLSQAEVDLSPFERAMAQSKARQMGLSPNRADCVTSRKPNGTSAGASTAELNLSDGLKEVLAAQLNSVQLQAVHTCCAPGDGFRLLQGPPGTGKTRVIVAMLSAIFATRKRTAKIDMPRPSTVGMLHIGASRSAKGVVGSAPALVSCGALSGKSRRVPRLLVAAPSNCAVDEIISRVLKDGLHAADGSPWQPTVVRIGPREAIRCAARHLMEHNTLRPLYRLGMCTGH